MQLLLIAIFRFLLKRFLPSLVKFYYDGSFFQQDETETDEWKEDENEKIMDAKVMRKGDKKLIVVEMPNPKARWGRPLE